MNLNPIPFIGNLRKDVRLNFSPIWHRCDRSAAFELVNQLRQKYDMPVLNAERLDNGWQYRTIFHEDLKVAQSEFVNFVLGWW